MKTYRRSIGDTRGMKGSGISLSILSDVCDEWVSLFTSEQYGYLSGADISLSKSPAAYQPNRVNVIMVLDESNGSDVDGYDLVISLYHRHGATIVIDCHGLDYSETHFAITDEVLMTYRNDIIVPILTCCVLCLRIEILSAVLGYQKLDAVAIAVAEFEVGAHISAGRIALPGFYPIESPLPGHNVLRSVLSRQISAC